jgi:hypothetical protein
LIEKGRVQAIEGGKIIIRQDRSFNCFGCMNQECKAKGGLMTAENPAGVDLKTGSRVETEVSGFSLTALALWALAPPFLGFAGVYVALGLTFPSMGEPARAAAGVLGLFLMAAILYLFRKKRPSKTIPRITRLLEE